MLILPGKLVIFRVYRKPTDDYSIIEEPAFVNLGSPVLPPRAHYTAVSWQLARNDSSAHDISGGILLNNY